MGRSAASTSSNPNRGSSARRWACASAVRLSREALIQPSFWALSAGSVKRMRYHSPFGVRSTTGGDRLAWGNPVIGIRNPIAPPLTIQRDDDGGVFTDFHLGAAYEGLGKNAEAVAQYNRFMSLASQKHEMRQVAEARLTALSSVGGK